MAGLRQSVLCMSVAAAALSWSFVASAEPSRSSLVVAPMGRRSRGRLSGAAFDGEPHYPMREDAFRHRTALGRAVSFLAAYHGNPLTVERSEELASLFYRFGRRWAVNPYLVASVACQESIFRSFPRKVRVRRCRTVLRRGRAETVCEDHWAGERGMMQVIPVYVKAGYRACTGRKRWHRLSELAVPEVNVCIGAWLLARKRDAILARMRQKKGFKVRGAEGFWKKRYAPCSRRQRHFCEGDMAEVCHRYWWVASYNWGSHQLLCGQTARGIDFAGYPIRVVGRLAYIWKHFAPPGEIWSSPQDYEFSRLLARRSAQWLTLVPSPGKRDSWVGLRLRRMDRLFELVRPEAW